MGAERQRKAADGSPRVVRHASALWVEPPWGTRLPGPPSLEGATRVWACWLWLLEPNTTRPGVALALGPSAHLSWAIPGAPKSLAPLALASRTPTHSACLHSSRRRTRRSRTSSSGVLPSPLSASSSLAAPCWSLPQAPRSPPPLLLLGGTPPRADGEAGAGAASGKRHARLLRTCLRELALLFLVDPRPPAWRPKLNRQGSNYRANCIGLARDVDPHVVSEGARNLTTVKH